MISQVKYPIEKRQPIETIKKAAAKVRHGVDKSILEMASETLQQFTEKDRIAWRWHIYVNEVLTRMEVSDITSTTPIKSGALSNWKRNQAVPHLMMLIWLAKADGQSPTGIFRRIIEEKEDTAPQQDDLAVLRSPKRLKAFCQNMTKAQRADLLKEIALSMEEM